MRINNNRRSKRVWTLIFSIFPGGGHYYLGLMHRGLFYSVLFLAGILLSTLFMFSAVPQLACIVVWVISAFDAYHCWRLMHRDEGEVQDDFPLKDWLMENYGDVLDDENGDVKRKYMRRGGIVLLTLGCFSLLSIFMHEIRYSSSSIMRFVGDMLTIVIRLLIPALLVFAGITLIRKNK